VKIALPHVALYVLLFLYLIAGAWAFAKIENRVKSLFCVYDGCDKIFFDGQAERLQQYDRLQRIGF
jgi:hypothetical protein